MPAHEANNHSPLDMTRISLDSSASLAGDMWGIFPFHTRGDMQMATNQETKVVAISSICLLGEMGVMTPLMLPWSMAPFGDG
jgi:hypothetical protein